MKTTCIKTLLIAIALIFSISGCNRENASLNTFDTGSTEERTDLWYIAKPSDTRWWYYFREGDYQNSLEMLYLTLELVELKDLHQLSEYYNRASWLHGRLGNYEQSAYYFNRALEIAQIDNDTPARLRALRNFIALHASHGDIEQFETAVDLKIAFRDSLLIKQYEVERKNELFARQAEDVQRKRNAIIFLAIITGLIVALSIITVLFYRSKVQKTAITVRHYEEVLKLKKEVKTQYDDSEKNDESKQLASELQQLFETEKIYRQQGLNVDDVVKLLDTNSKYLSNVISQYYGKNFTGYVNTFRVEEAIEMLKQQGEGGKYANYTIQAIGEMVGFNSRTSFYRTFKRIIGVTPSEYMDNIDAEEMEDAEAESENTEQ